MTDNQQKEVIWRRKVLRISFLLLLGFSFVTWLAINRIPSDQICEFRDSWMLMMLWPGNDAIFDQIKTFSFPEHDQCIFFAWRSTQSLYFALFTGSLMFAGRRLRVRPSRASMPTSMVLITIGTTIFYFFFDKFDVISTGRGEWFVLHGTDPIWWLSVKSTCRIFTIYLFLFLYFRWLFAYLNPYYGPEDDVTSVPSEPPAHER